MKEKKSQDAERKKSSSKNEYTDFIKVTSPGMIIAVLAVLIPVLLGIFVLSRGSMNRIDYGVGVFFPESGAVGIYGSGEVRRNNTHYGEMFEGGAKVASMSDGAVITMPEKGRVLDSLDSGQEADEDTPIASYIPADDEASCDTLLCFAPESDFAVIKKGMAATITVSNEETGKDDVLSGTVDDVLDTLYSKENVARYLGSRSLTETATQSDYSSLMIVKVNMQDGKPVLQTGGVADEGLTVGKIYDITIDVGTQSVINYLLGSQ